ncbi:ABC transporter [Candidatus Phyllobacterium onerii]|nr:ABC transporter [Phyllobacterium sp. IY22]
MNRVLITVVAVLTVISLSACGSIGKGKAPPPMAEPAAAPVYK